MASKDSMEQKIKVHLNELQDAIVSISLLPTSKIKNKKFEYNFKKFDSKAVLYRQDINLIPDDTIYYFLSKFSTNIECIFKVNIKGRVSLCSVVIDKFIDPDQAIDAIFAKEPNKLRALSTHDILADYSSEIDKFTHLYLNDLDKVNIQKQRQRLEKFQEQFIHLYNIPAYKNVLEIHHRSDTITQIMQMLDDCLCYLYSLTQTNNDNEDEVKILPRPLTWFSPTSRKKVEAVLEEVSHSIASIPRI